jgi:hypothetical protein
VQCRGYQAYRLSADNRSSLPKDPRNGAAYLITVKDSSGNFTTRTVVTLHADHTMSVVAADQGGPTFFFTSRLGLWKPDGKSGVVRKIRF